MATGDSSPANSVSTLNVAAWLTTNSGISWAATAPAITRPATTAHTVLRRTLSTPPLFQT